MRSIVWSAFAFGMLAGLVGLDPAVARMHRMIVVGLCMCVTAIFATLADRSWR